jgi:hypothetical protein
MANYQKAYTQKYNDKKNAKLKVQTALRNYDLIYDNNTFNKLYEAGLLNETKFSSNTIELLRETFQRK